MEYDYDVREVFDRYLRGECALSNYIDALNFQECAYPEHHIKMRCLENHDQPRICSFVQDEKALQNFTAFLYFLKGTTLLYAGQEFCCSHTPSLFEKEVFPRDGAADISPFLRKLYDLKKAVLSPADWFSGIADDAADVAVLERDDNRAWKLGVFSLKGCEADVRVPFPDGVYTNHISGNEITVSGGMLHCAGEPLLLTTPCGNALES